MEFVSGAIMLGSAGVCLGGSLRARHLVGALAAGVMLAAMIDHVLIGAVPGLIWAVLLTTCGILLALPLRTARWRTEPDPLQSFGPANAGVTRSGATTLLPQTSLPSAMRQRTTQHSGTRQAGEWQAGERQPAVHEAILHRAGIAASALAYLAMAWLLATHGSSGSAAGTLAARPHGGHGSTPFTLEWIAFALVGTLTAALYTIGGLGLARRIAPITLETWAMGAMLTAMLLPAIVIQ